MTSAITLRYTTDPSAPVCRHCGGTGHEPERVIPQHLQPLIDELREAGQKRASFSSSRSLNSGMESLYEAYDDIRELTAKAESAGIDRQTIADTVGLSRAQLYNILTGRTGAR
jgi:hypothetical protein